MMGMYLFALIMIVLNVAAFGGALRGATLVCSRPREPVAKLHGA
jgi:hypothetical protein